MFVVSVVFSSTLLRCCVSLVEFLFFFNDTATTEIYTLSLHDALPICGRAGTSVRAATRYFRQPRRGGRADHGIRAGPRAAQRQIGRAHAELQSLAYLVCRLLLEKKNK